jgi:2,3-bisphosphoglycerate-independent phosphoglycerate mutase
MRCNLICIENSKIKNHSAGHISNEEAEELILFLQKELGNEQVNFFSGVSYRHLLKIKGGKKQLKCTPPHDVPGTLFADVMIQADTEEVADASLNDPVVGSSIVLDIGEMKRLIKLVKAEENEAIIAAANALENIASTSSSTRIRRVANEALKAIRARRN